MVCGDVDPGSRYRLVNRAGEVLTDDIALDSPGHDPLWTNADQRRGSVQHLGRPANFDAPRLPRRQDIVDHDRGTTGFHDIAVFLGPFQAVAADVDRFVFGVVGPTDRRDVWNAVLTDGARRARRRSPCRYRSSLSVKRLMTFLSAVVNGSRPG